MVKAPTKTVGRKRAAPAASPPPAEKDKMVDAPTKTVGRKRAAPAASPPPAQNGSVEKAPAKTAGRKRAAPAPAPPVAKKVKLDFRLFALSANDASSGGVMLALGQGDTGQLGLGEDILDRKKPALVKDLEGVVDVCAGGMHTLCLTKEGVVYSFGCNDEGALGRITEEDEECFTPGKVDVPGKVVQICAGDSHSAAMTEDGKAYYWGTFRDSSGSFGLTLRGIEKTPVPLAHHLELKKIASGADHMALLTQDGAVYTLGCAEQGQLARVGERFAGRDGSRRGLATLLEPDKVHAKNRKIVFKDIWAGSWSTYAMTSENKVLVAGLNNYNQLGVEKGNTFFTMVESKGFSSKKISWRQIAPGQHHTLALDDQGRVHAIGRAEYGRIGLGEDVTVEAKTPTVVPFLADKKVTDVSCGTAVSFAVTADGEVFSWGMGTNGQLGHEDEEEDAWTPKLMLGKQLENRRALLVSGGGQHTVVLAKDK